MNPRRRENPLHSRVYRRARLKENIINRNPDSRAGYKYIISLICEENLEERGGGEMRGKDSHGGPARMDRTDRCRIGGERFQSGCRAEYKLPGIRYSRVSSTQASTPGRHLLGCSGLVGARGSDDMYIIFYIIVHT